PEGPAPGRAGRGQRAGDPAAVHRADDPGHADAPRRRFDPDLDEVGDEAERGEAGIYRPADRHHTGTRSVKDLRRLAERDIDGLDLDRGLSGGSDRRGEVEWFGARHAEPDAQLAEGGVDRRERARGAPRSGGQ